MAREWTYELVNGDGMVIRRDYSSNNQWGVTFDAEVRIPVDPSAGYAVQATDDTGTYVLVNNQGVVLATFSVVGVPEVTISKGEPVTFATIRLQERSPVIAPWGSSSDGGSSGGGGGANGIWFDSRQSAKDTVLPDGSIRSMKPKTACQCRTCQTARGAMMDRDQVARVAAQIGSSLMPNNSQWMNRFTVESTSSSRVYTVAQRRSDNVWGCSCPAWINRRHCKHLDDILGRLAKLTEFDVTDPAVLDMLRSARTAYLDLDASAAFPVTKAPTYHRHIDL